MRGLIKGWIEANVQKWQIGVLIKHLPAYTHKHRCFLSWRGAIVIVITPPLRVMFSCLRPPVCQSTTFSFQTNKQTSFIQIEFHFKFQSYWNIAQTKGRIQMWVSGMTHQCQLHCLSSLQSRDFLADSILDKYASPTRFWNITVKWVLKG